MIICVIFRENKDFRRNYISEPNCHLKNKNEFFTNLELVSCKINTRKFLKQKCTLPTAWGLKFISDKN